MLLAHFGLAEAAASHPRITPVGALAPSRRLDPSMPEALYWRLPFHGATYGLSRDGAPVWVDLLEQMVQRAPSRFGDYRDAVAALIRHYEEQGNLGRTEWLRSLPGFFGTRDRPG
jgi:hypothetical protein